MAALVTARNEPRGVTRITLSLTVYGWGQWPSPRRTVRGVEHALRGLIDGTRSALGRLQLGARIHDRPGHSTYELFRRLRCLDSVGWQ